MSNHILLTLIAIGSSAITLILKILIERALKSREEKKTIKLELEKKENETTISELDVELRRVDVSKIKDKAIQDIVTDTYVWIDEMNEALSDMRSKNLKLEAAVFELTKRAEHAERLRDWYKNKLKQLIDICISRCPDLDIEEYREEIE